MKKKDIYWDYPCDLCGSWEGIEVPHSRNYQSNNEPLHICVRCGFVYMRSRRSADRIAEAWSNEIFGDVYTAHIPAVRARLMYAVDFIDVHLKLRGKRICDIGAGEGIMLNMMRQNQYGAKDVFGIEPSLVNCERLNKMGIRNFNGTIEEFLRSKESKTYKADIVTITWTLENCHLCRDMLKGAYEIAGKNGFVVMATGSRILVPFKKPLYLYLSKNPADTNCFRFSANTLRGILAVSGFKVEHVNRYIDSDILCMIARKMPKSKSISWQGDSYLNVYNFFERWHAETMLYYPPEKTGKCSGGRT